MNVKAIVKGFLIQLSVCVVAFAAYDATVDGAYTGTDGATVDGSKNYKTITAALADVSSSNASAYTIYIKNGNYYEHITMSKPYVSFIGQSRDSTVLYYDLAQGSANGSSTWGSDCATLKITKTNFIAENMTIANTWDYRGNEAKESTDATKIKNTQNLAIKITTGSNYTFFYNCKIVSYQDALFADVGKIFCKKCIISGAVDFIYGAGQLAVDSSDIVCRYRSSMKENDIKGIVSAPSTNKDSLGMLFTNCTVKRETDSIPASCYALGRPWHPSGDSAKLYNVSGMSVYKNCYLDDLVKAAGWDSMSSKMYGTDTITVTFYPNNLAHARFYEYNSTGPGAVTTSTDWRKILTASEAENYTVSNVLGGWDPEATTGAVTKKNASISASIPQMTIEKLSGVMTLRIRTSAKINTMSLFAADGRKVLTVSNMQNVNGSYVINLYRSAGKGVLSKGLYFAAFNSSEGQFSSHFVIAE